MTTIVTASYIGHLLVDLVAPTSQELETVREWYKRPPDDPLPFLALAALGELGVTRAFNREVALKFMDAEVCKEIAKECEFRLIEKIANPDNSHLHPEELTLRMASFLKQAQTAFYDNEDAEMGPHWHAGLVICCALKGSDDIPNPEDALFYGHRIHNITMGTIEYFGKLRTAHIEIR